jgi:phosphopantetheinyl transferase
VLYSTTTTGSVAEVLTSTSSNLTTGNFQQHRFAIQSQGQPIAVAQAQFNVSNTGTNEE